jgi:hypothetical protein
MLSSSKAWIAASAIALANTGAALCQESAPGNIWGSNPNNLPQPSVQVFTNCTPGYALDATLNACLNPEGQLSPGPNAGGGFSLGGGGSSSTASGVAASTSSGGSVAAAAGRSGGAANNLSATGVILTTCPLQEMCD